MRISTSIKHICFLTNLIAFSALAADVKVEGFSGPGNEPPIWVSINGVNGEALQVLQFDLYIQGFNFTNAEAAQFLISGRANGNFQASVTDKYAKSTVVSH